MADRRACPVLDYLQKLMVMAQQVERQRHRVSPRSPVASRYYCTDRTTPVGVWTRPTVAREECAAVLHLSVADIAFLAQTWRPERIRADGRLTQAQWE